jgi:outer membrane protein
MENRIRQQLWLLIIVFTTLGTSAQNGLFSLEGAQNYAMQNSFILKNSRYDVVSAQKEVWKTISIGLPQISGTAGYTKFLDLPVSLIPGEFFGGEPGTYMPVKFGQDYNADFGFSVSQIIFDGSYIVGVGSAKIYLDLRKHANEKSEIEIRDAVTQAYYMVLIGTQNKRVMEENLHHSKNLFNETKAYFDNGFREESDVDQMAILVKNAENEILKAEREIAVAKVVLKYAMGYPMAEEIELTDNLEGFLKPLISQERAPGMDVAGHVDYRLAVTNFMASERLLRLEKTTFLPTLSAFYNYSKMAFGNQANLFKPGVQWFPSSMVGLQLSVPIFNSGRKVLSVQQANIELDKAANDRRLAETTLQMDYLTAAADMETAREKYENDVENRQLASRILEKSKIKFSNGLATSTELSQLETQYLQTHGAYIMSVMQLLQADLKLKKALGTL